MTRSQQAVPNRFAIVCPLAIGLSLLLAAGGFGDQRRPPKNDADLRFWLENMVWHHRYSDEEIRQVTGLSERELRAKLAEFNISRDAAPPRPQDRLLLLPFPGGRHPRIGFLEGAVDPQRDTKLSAFCPWDEHSYVVLDVPEAIWSHLGLTYLAHTHVDTIWTKRGITLPQQEWERHEDGSFRLRRRLPNGIEFGTIARPRSDHIELAMWLRNGTAETLQDLRVQNCVMLKGAEGFTQQNNDNKRLDDGYAVAHSPDSRRWIVSGWSHLHRTWANPRCPCLHADPRFPDCAPGETQWLRGWLSFYEGTNIEQELARIEATGWRDRPITPSEGSLNVQVLDAETRRPLPSRVYVQHTTSGSWHSAHSSSPAGTAVEYHRERGPRSGEHHTTLSADPFYFDLAPGKYRLLVEHGKEYRPHEQEVTVTGDPVHLTIRLQRFANMAQHGWYSGDIHIHRTLDELPNVLLAEDVNVALPLTYWVRDSQQIPAGSGPAAAAVLQQIDPTHVIWPVNTEYEIFTVDGRRHTQGAVFVLNHQRPLTLPAPPVLPLAEVAQQQQALLDLDKHSWNWSPMIVPLMKVDLFELTNNHHWRTAFGFPAWTLENAPRNWPEIEQTREGFTESGWTEFGMQTYYALLNCGFRLRVSGGTASGVHPVPLGYGRVYVHLQDGFRYENWIEGLNAGRSFVTNGPLLNLRFNGALPGEVWRRDTPVHEIRISGTIDSVHPLKAIQVVRNGQIAQVLTPANSRSAAGAFHTAVDTLVPVDGTSWLAVRCYEDRPAGKVSFAHTNPVFVDVEGQPLKPRRRDVEYFLERIDAEVKRNTGILSEEALAEYYKARKIYADLLHHVDEK